MIAHRQACENPKVTGLNQLLDEHRYRGLIVDLWGVMHNGKAFFPEALKRSAARQRGVKVQFLSNAPRRAASIASMLADVCGPSPMTASFPAAKKAGSQ